MVCVMTDAFTKYVELVALSSKTAEEVAKAIMDTWITRYSTPKEILTDGGKEFANNLMKCLCKELGVLHRQTSPYHPDTNASAEVFNRTMKHYLAAALDEPYLDWEELLPALRIAYNTSVSKATRATPFSLVFGMEPNMPFFDMEHALTMDETYPDMLSNLKAMRRKAEEINLQYKAKYKKYYDKANKTEMQDIRKGQEILVENSHKVGPNPKFHPAFNGPFPVIEVDGTRIHYRDGKKAKVAHMNRVKKVKVSEKGEKRRAEEELLNTEKRPALRSSPKYTGKTAAERRRRPLRGVNNEGPKVQENEGNHEDSRQDSASQDYSDAEAREIRDQTHYSNADWEEDPDITMQSVRNSRKSDESADSSADSEEFELARSFMGDRSQRPGRDVESSDSSAEQHNPKILDFTNESTLLDLPMDKEANYFPPTPNFTQYREGAHALSDSESEEEEESNKWRESERRGASACPQEHLVRNKEREREQGHEEFRNLRSRGPIVEDQNLPNRPLEWKPYRKQKESTERREQCS